MKLYNELNLNTIREKCNLDFAHYTYEKGQCSCCYGPKNMSTKYWTNSVIPEHDDYTFILFNNADNGSGVVTAFDEIYDYTCIEHKFNSTEQAHLFCRLLKEQLGGDYVVTYRDNTYTIVIHDYFKFDEADYDNFPNVDNTMLILK